MNVRLVHTHDNIFGYRIDKLPELGGIEKLPRRIVGVTDADDAGLRIDGVRHRLEVDPVVAPDRDPSDFAAELLGLARDRGVRGKRGDDVPAAVPKGREHQQVQDLRRSDPGKDRLGRHIVMRRERLLELVVKRIAVHPEHGLGNRLDGPSR